MDNKAKWIDMCKRLPVGGKQRVKCCGNDLSRIIEHKADKYISNCFRSTCQNYVEMKTGIARLTAEACKEMKEEIKEHTVPRDTTYNPSDFPTQAIVWLSNAGLHQGIWEKYGLGYSAKYNRVVVPIIMDGKQVGATLRALTDGDVKYLMHTDFRGALYTCNNHLTKDTRKDVVVVTEDILSAIRISEATNKVDVVCILGTGVMLERALYLVQHYSKVHFWLDGDAAGITASQKWRRRLSPYVKVSDTNIFGKDPKDFTDDDITQQLDLDIQGG